MHSFGEVSLIHINLDTEFIFPCFLIYNSVEENKWFRVKEVHIWLLNQSEALGQWIDFFFNTIQRNGTNEKCEPIKLLF